MHFYLLLEIKKDKEKTKWKLREGKLLWKDKFDIFFTDCYTNVFREFSC